MYSLDKRLKTGLHQGDTPACSLLVPNPGDLCMCVLPYSVHCQLEMTHALLTWM